MNEVARTKKHTHAQRKKAHNVEVKSMYVTHSWQWNSCGYINASTTMYEALKTNNRHLPPLKCTFTAVHHVWVVLTPVSGEIRPDLPQLAVQM